MAESKTGEPNLKRRKLFPNFRKIHRLGLLLWPHARKHKGLLFGGALLSIGLIGFRLAQPWPLKWIIDILSGSKDSSAFLGLQYEQAIIVFSISYVAISLFAGLSDYWQTILLSGLGNRVIYSFRNKTFAHLFHLSASFHDKKSVGELVTRIVYDTSRLRRGVNGIMIRTFQVVFTFMLNVIVILLLNWQIAIVIAVIGTLSLILMNRNGKRILSESRKHRRREGQLATVVAEDMNGISEIQAFRTNNFTDSRFNKRNVKSLASEQKVRKIAAKMTTQVQVLLSVGICVVLWIGAIAVDSGELTVGTLVLISHYAVGLYGPFRQFSRQAARTGRTMAVAERLTRIIERDAAITNVPDAKPLLELPKTIRFSNVSIKKSRSQRVSRKWMLNNISCEFHRGERIAVMGTNGAGKSTLIKLLLRLSDPQLGSIELDGINIKQFTIESLRNNISVVFQDNVFFGLTIRENIAFAKPDATIEEIENCIVRCGIDQWISGLKNGLNTRVRRQGGIFSGGEKQKIAIARALLRNGNIWLLDEPMNSLDEASREYLVNLLLEATENRTTFWVTHDRSILQNCSRVLVLDEGNIAFVGTPEEFSSWVETTNVDKVQIFEQKVSEINQKEGY